MKLFGMVLLGLAVCAVVPVLVECAGGKPASLQNSLAGLIGSAPSAATARLGPADSIRPAAAGTTYTWIAKSHGVATPGRHSSQGGELAATIRSGKKVAAPPQPCTIVMTTDVHEAIKAFRITGDQSHCEAFSSP